MITLDQYDFNGKRALIRVDFNVPLDANHQITDDIRIKAAVPTIQKILRDGGSVVLMSHLGRPKNGPEIKFSLRHVVGRLGQLLETDVKFASNCIGDEVLAQCQQLQPGQVLLLENLRFHPQEKEGDPDFAKQLAQLGDVYVNDAFGTAHRAHASTAIIAQYMADKVCGYVIEKELTMIDQVLQNAQAPFTAIMGGAKISDKIKIIDTLLPKVDHLIIGGGMAYTFFKAMGGEVGASLVEKDSIGLAKSLIDQAKEQNTELHLPIDSLIADSFSNDAACEVALNHQIKAGWMGLDIGPQAIEVFTNIVKKSKTILWNGPMGVFELSNFANGTKAIAKAMVEATKNGAFSLVGGGDSAAAVNFMGLADQVTYVSTGGGALLEYVEGKTLPGIAALAQEAIKHD